MPVAKRLYGFACLPGLGGGVPAVAEAKIEVNETFEEMKRR